MLHRLSEGKAREARRLLRFVAVGILNTAFGYSIYLAGLWLALAPALALAIATCVGALFNYLSISTLVFQTATLVKLPAFSAVYLVTYFFNAMLLHVLTTAAVAPWLAQILLLPMVVGANYGLMRMWVFRNAR